MDNLKRKQDNQTRYSQIEHALTSVLSDDFVRNALFTNMKINAGISFFGIIANLFNIVVFVKQGFKDTVNISLTSLAVSDLASLIVLVWMWLCHDPTFMELVRHVFDPIDISYLTGGIPRAYFTLVGSWITSLVSTERCISVIRPLHVKFVFTQRRLVFINLCIFVAVSGPSFPLYYSSRLTRKINPASNSTYLGLTFIENRHNIDFFFSVFTVIMSVCTFVIVCACATIIILTLAKQNKWRAQMTDQSHKNPTPKANSERERNEEISLTTQRSKGRKDLEYDSKPIKKRETKTITGSSLGDNRATKTVTLIAIMFIICYLPGTLNKLVMTFVPDYSKAGRYSNMFKFFWSVSFITEAICSSANVFVYVSTNTKFKETSLNIFRCLR